LPYINEDEDRIDRILIELMLYYLTVAINAKFILNFFFQL